MIIFTVLPGICGSIFQERATVGRHVFHQDGIHIIEKVHKSRKNFRYSPKTTIIYIYTQISNTSLSLNYSNSTPQQYYDSKWVPLNPKLVSYQLLYAISQSARIVCYIITSEYMYMSCILIEFWQPTVATASVFSAPSSFPQLLFLFGKHE